jgi:HEPN domain-containing protein
MRKEVERWFLQAKADFKTAKDCLKAKNYYASVFFSQQAVEKALKAFFIHKKRTLHPKTHDLTELVAELKVKKFERIARKLTPEFVITRYPDAANGVPFMLYDEEDAKEALGYAREVFFWVRAKLKRKK